MRSERAALPFALISPDRRARVGPWRSSSARSTRAPPAPGSWCSTTTGTRSAATSSSTSRSCRGPAGSSTTRPRSGSAPQDGHRATALGTAGHRRRRPRRGRHHQPARDHGRVGPAHRRARTTTRSSGRTPAPTGSPRRSTATARGDVIRARAGLPPATYFSGGKLHWILENVDGVRADAERGRRPLRHDRHLADLEPHRRPDGGVHVTDVTNASRTMLMDLRDPRLGRRAARRSSASRARCCPRSGPSSARRSTARPRTDGPFGGEVPIAGDLGDQHAATRRPGLLRARRGQEHLRHRQLPAAQHRHRDRAARARPAHHGRLPVRRRSRPSTRWRARSP